MKKKFIWPLMILSVLILLAGCKKGEEKEQEPVPPVEVEEPVEPADDNEKEVIMNDFNKLVDEDSDVEELVSFVNKNIKRVSQIEADTMIDSLENRLEENIDKLTNLIFATDKDDELMSIAGTEKFFPEGKISEIKNTELKEELTKAYDNMYKLVNLEGGFYPIIDYVKLKDYNDNVSNEWKEYFDIMAMDSEQIPLVDGGLTISYDELADRILATERHLNTYIEGPRQDKLINMYEVKLRAYLKGLPNTPIAESSTNRIKEEVYKSYQNTANNEGYIASFLVHQYIEDIDQNKLTIDNGILAKADEYLAEAVRMLREYK